MEESPPDLVERFHAEGKLRWPSVEVPREAFAAFLQDRAPEREQLAAIHGADLYLACACSRDDARAIAAFDERFIREVPAFLAGIERSAAVIEEVRQLVRQRLFVAEDPARRKIHEYSGRGSLASWVRVVALRVASNRRRDDKAPKLSLDGDEADSQVLSTVDPELAVIKARYQGVFNEALAAAFASLPPRERLLFRMHYLDGLNLDAIGLVFSVHRATAARWLAGAREAVHERTLTLIGDQLNVDATELESLLRVVRNELDVSLRGVLCERGSGAE